jgi:hypothetical protein
MVRQTQGVLWVSSQSKMKLQTKAFLERSCTCPAVTSPQQADDQCGNQQKRVMLVEKAGKLLPLTSQVCCTSKKSSMQSCLFCNVEGILI